MRLKVGTCLLLVWCSFALPNCGGKPAVATIAFQPLILAPSPEGMSIGGVLSLPEDNPTNAPPYSLEIWQDNGQGRSQIGIFSRPSQPTSPTRGQENDIAQLGPNGIVGIDVGLGSTELLCASRTASIADLKAMGACKSSQPARVLASSGWHRVAQEADSIVPGFGSLPMATTTGGFVISYVGQPQSTGGVPPSIVVGVFAGSDGDITVLDWWLGSARLPDAISGGHLYSTPAYSDVGSNGTPPPPATLLAQVVGKTVRLVRVSEVTQTAQETEAELISTTTDNWEALRNQVQHQ